MAPKRGSGEMEVACVQGAQKRWAFSAGMSVEEALGHISRETETSAHLLVLESKAGEAEIILARDSKLAATGLAVDLVSHYYITPDMDDLVSNLAQEWKDDNGAAAQRMLMLQSRATLVYLEGLEGARMSWSSHDFWGYLCDSLTLKHPTFFPKQQLPFYTSLVFKSLFARSKLPTLVTVVLDEADSLLDVPSDIVHEFFATIRSIKSDKNAYNLHGFLLVGVETVKDLLEAQYDMRVADAARTDRTYMPSSTPSRVSPFPHDHVLASSRFTLEHVRELLQQAVADRPSVAIEATYSRILGFIQKQEQDAEACKLLIRYLETPGLYCGPETLVQLCDFIAHGVLAASAVTVLDSDDEKSEEETYYVRISMPLLRTAMLRRCTVFCDDVDAPPCATRLDHVWLLLQAIKTLDGEDGTILKHAYPCIPVTVLPEVKEEIVLDQRRSEMRCDFLICDGPNFSKFAVKLVANGTMTQYSAQIFVINFCMDRPKGQEHIVVPGHDSLVFMSINFHPSKCTASVTIVDSTGKREVEVV
ncbi:hypothetical protein SELMODRAFT_439818 [Selaginella moellendorffii]|uniref:Uncharacterized protein n=1 Tax=Selaginella moellendorffii TaxID=88036 RepID=D8R7J2_SELML|nr:hypothetical protein SELMODRAFT_439818 [Selaginella moellendorffii]